MNKFLAILLVILMLTVQSVATSANALHDTDTVVGNILSGNYVMLLATLMLFLATMI